MRRNISGMGCKRFWTRSLRPGYAAARPIVDTLQFQWDGIFYIRLHVRLEEVLRAEGTKEKTDTGE